MSEAEKKRRLDYKKNRKKWMTVQLVAIIVVLVIAISSFIAYNQLNKAYYIEYTEQGDIDYKVFLKENNFFEEEWIGKDQSYVASLIDSIVADFEYELKMGVDNIAYDYSYSIFAQLIISDKDSGEPIYDPVYELVPEKKVSQNGSHRLKITETAVVDYVSFNELATEFTETYGLDHSISTLLVTMKVNVISKCESFEENSNNSYSISMLVPLVSSTNTVNIQTTTSVPAGESKVLAYVGALNQNLFKLICIVAAALCALQIIGVIVFAYLTRNEDIRYEAKIKRILSNYRSFIQVITNEFDTDGYQILTLGSFNEMLSIRDTIQSPVLMNENEDKTCTRFLVPTATKILYVFDIKVENYNEIYSNASESADLAEEADFILEDVIEPEILADSIDEEALAEALEEPTFELDEIEYVDVIDEETENGVEVIGVVWPERANKNKIYRYDPDGSVINDGDIVLVPSRDIHRNRDIIRKAAVAHGNHKVDPETLKHPLKKIVGIVKRRS